MSFPQGHTLSSLPWSSKGWGVGWGVLRVNMSLLSFGLELYFYTQQTKGTSAKHSIQGPQIQNTISTTGTETQNSNQSGRVCSSWWNTGDRERPSRQDSCLWWRQVWKKNKMGISCPHSLGAPPFSYKWILTDPEPNPSTSCPTCESVNSKMLLFIRQVDLDPRVP